MVANYWPADVQKEENGSPSPVKKINRSNVTTYLEEGRRFTFRGITLYTKPTDFLEVGFLIRRKAGHAVLRNKTRRVFNGFMLNTPPNFNPKTGYLFLFHRAFMSGRDLAGSINTLLSRNTGFGE